MYRSYRNGGLVQVMLRLVEMFSSFSHSENTLDTIRLAGYLDNLVMPRSNSIFASKES